jgi:hypothetical protein
MSGLRYQVYELHSGKDTVRIGDAPIAGFNNVEAARVWIDREMSGAAIILEVCPSCGHVLGRVEGENSPPVENGQLSLLKE